jgi:hypothetical protein
LGQGHEPGGGQDAAQQGQQHDAAPPRRSTRERRQAPLASELPASLAPPAQAAAGASGVPHEFTRPPHPAAGGARRCT